MASRFCRGLIRGSKLLNEVILKHWKKRSSEYSELDERTTRLWWVGTEGADILIIMIYSLFAHCMELDKMQWKNIDEKF